MRKSKRIQLSLGVLAIAILTACGPKVEDQPILADAAAKPKPAVLSDSQIPHGHWLVNPLHCLKQLPSHGVYDFKIKSQVLTTNGIKQQGEWNKLDAENIIPRLSEYLASDLASCVDIDIGDISFASYTAPGNRLEVGFVADKDILFVLKPDSILLAKNFDVQVFRDYTFVEINMVDEHATEASDNEEPQSPIEVTYGQG